MEKEERQDILLKIDRTSNKEGGQDESIIKMSGLTARWKQEESEDTLSSIDLSMKKGQLLAVIGPVGSGKVSLVTERLTNISHSEFNHTVHPGGAASFQRKYQSWWDYIL